jgi:GNAT superfamily N-acetyltransferase
LIEVRPPLRHEARELRATRLRALADAPIELGAFLEEEEAFPLSYWQGIAEFSEVAEERVSFVAVEDGGFVGMVGGDLDEAGSGAARLVALWVERSARGRGVGRRLVEGVVDWARRRGAARIELWVVDDNDAARALYERCGFTPTGREQAVPWAPERTEWLLVRTL